MLYLWWEGQLFYLRLEGAVFKFCSSVTQGQRGRRHHVRRVEGGINGWYGVDAANN